ARKLAEGLGPGFRCYVAFSAWTPYIRDAVARARADGCTRLVGVSLYPQWCSATTESAFFDLRKAVAGSMPVAAVDRYPEDAGYLDALTSTVQVLAVPVAFVSDHAETLREQRILLRGVAAEAGIARYEVANAINDCRLYARALARLVRQALDSTPVFKVPAGR